MTGRVIAVAIDVHRVLGPGLLESCYEACLHFELIDRGLSVARQRPVPLAYRGVALPVAYRLDLVIEGRLVVEIKAVERLIPLHQCQLLTYLKLSGLRLGLLLNFNVPTLAKGIRRVING